MIFVSFGALFRKVLIFGEHLTFQHAFRMQHVIQPTLATAYVRLGPFSDGLAIKEPIKLLPFELTAYPKIERYMRTAKTTLVCASNSIVAFT